ncbi:MAG: hypothetical protein JXQ72_03345 [Anaerolineae bacterium]|nr:hypothetical protein [Anaerolineae bacterium]
MPNQAITSLAILMVDWEERNRDYLQNFVPMVTECVRLSAEKIISLPDIQQQLLERFGLKLPQGVIKKILKRAEKGNFVEFDERLRAYKPNRQKLSKLNFARVQREVGRRFDNLITHLIEFCSQNYNITWSITHAEAVLQTYLAENEFFLLNTNSKRILLPIMEHPPRCERYLIGAFIRHIQSHSPTDFEYLETIFKGNMLANAIFIPEGSSSVRQKWSVNIYFDTAFLIQALGYNGETIQEPRRELLSSLSLTGTSLRCFRHNLEEIEGSLYLCSQLIDSNIRNIQGPIVASLDHFIEKGYGRADIVLAISNLERDLNRLRVFVEDKPEYIRQHTIDEQALTDLLKSGIGYTNRRTGEINQQALDRDVASISAIATLRKGRTYPRIEDCPAVFVTTNNKLASVTREFFASSDSDRNAAHCLTEYTLANLLWLRQPNETPNLPRKHIIANCYAATQPDEYLWDLYLSKIERLREEGRITIEDYYTFRHVQEAKDALMEVTLGEEGRLSAEGTVSEIIRRARIHMQSETYSELQATQKRLAEKDAKESEQRTNIAKRAKTQAARITKGIKYAFYVVLMIFLIISAPIDLLPFEIGFSISQPLRYILTLILIIGIVWSWFSMKNGRTFDEQITKIEQYIAKRREAYFLNIAGLEESNPDKDI